MDGLSRTLDELLADLHLVCEASRAAMPTPRERLQVIMLEAEIADRLKHPRAKRYQRTKGGS